MLSLLEIKKFPTTWENLLKPCYSRVWPRFLAKLEGWKIIKIFLIPLHCVNIKEISNPYERWDYTSNNLRGSSHLCFPLLNISSVSNPPHWALMDNLPSRQQASPHRGGVITQSCLHERTIYIITCFRFFFQNNTEFQIISLVSTFSKLFSKLTFWAPGTWFCCAKSSVVNLSSMELEFLRLDSPKALERETMKHYQTKDPVKKNNETSSYPKTQKRKWRN